MKKKIVLILLIFALFMLSGCDEFLFTAYETDDIDDYGEYPGNSDTVSAQKILLDFLPEILGPWAEDITYHYKACTSDSIACEAYLEYTLSDNDIFFSVLESYGISPDECATVDYLPGMKEFSIGSDFDIAIYDDGEESHTQIEKADIRKIYFDTENNKVIFFALIVYDGGGTSITYLDYFFTRHNVDFQEFVTDCFYVEDT